MKNPLLKFIAIVCLVPLLVACTLSGEPADTLYTQLGKKPGIEAIVDEFLYSLSDNNRVLPLFANTNINRFREQFTLQLCAVSGGPCEYSGDSMEATHRGMNIDRAQFNAVVSDLIEAMERRQIPTGTQNALLARLAPMFEQITGQ